MMNAQELHQLACKLYPIHRSITGDGIRQTLNIIQQYVKDIKIVNIQSGYQAFDWNVPDEWNIKNAFVADESGNKIIDFNKNNLHILGYSEPVDRWMSFSELDKYL